MGSCTSRPTESEIEKHKQSLSNKNDKSFYFVPRVYTSSFKEAKADLLERIEFFELRQKSQIQGIPQTPKLTVEVQKGVHLVKKVSCFKSVNPFVRVSLQPNGPRYESKSSDAFYPSWYSVFSFCQSLSSFQKVLVEVLNRTDNQTLGQAEVYLEELSTQQVNSSWHSLKNSSNSSASVRMRIQLIKDEKSLLDQLLEDCKSKLQKLV